LANGKSRLVANANLARKFKGVKLIMQAGGGECETFLPFKPENTECKYMETANSIRKRSQQPVIKGVKSSTAFR
jgi:hypothetical protein